MFATAFASLAFDKYCGPNPNQEEFAIYDWLDGPEEQPISPETKGFEYGGYAAISDQPDSNLVQIGPKTAPNTDLFKLR
jgi:hypothetical protein